MYYLGVQRNLGDREDDRYWWSYRMVKRALVSVDFVYFLEVIGDYFVLLLANLYSNEII
jgi:hypothetical protein